MKRPKQLRRQAMCAIKAVGANTERVKMVKTFNNINLLKLGLSKKHYQWNFPFLKSNINDRLKTDIDVRMRLQNKHRLWCMIS